MPNYPTPDLTQDGAQSIDLRRLADVLEYLQQHLVIQGNGNPNTLGVVASPPALFLNEAGGAGATLWVKESGVNTGSGWVAK